MKENDLWLEKYRPNKLSEYIGKKDDINLIKKWIKNYFNDKIETEKVLLLHGNPGVGKTTLANIIFSRYNYEIVEYNTSSYRSKKMIKEKIGCISTKSIISNKIKLKNIIKKNITFKKVGLLMDEIDGITTNQESSGIQELINIIDNKNEKNKMPIICTCNSIKNKKIKLLTKRALTIKLYKPTNKELEYLANLIIKREQIELDNNIIKDICNISNEYRQLINLLYQIYILIKKLKKSKSSKIKINKEILKLIDQSRNKVTKTETETETETKTETKTLENINYITDYELKYVDTIQEKISYLLNNNVDYNDMILSCQKESQLFILSLFKNTIKIIKQYKITDNKIRYTIYKHVLDNLIHGERLTSRMFKNQEWELFELIGYIGCLSNIIIFKKNVNLFDKNKKSLVLKKNGYTLDYHSDFNRMTQNIAFYIKRSKIINKELMDNFDINGFYYIDKISSNNKSSTYENIMETNKKITKKINEYFIKY